MKHTNKVTKRNSRNSTSILVSRKFTRTRKSKKTNNSNKSVTIHNDNVNVNDNDNANANANDNNNKNKNNKSFSIGFISRRFLSRTQSLVRTGPKLKKKDLFALYISDNKSKLINGNTLDNKEFYDKLFNENKINCVCENIFNKPLGDDCNCDNLKKYSSQGKSGASIYSIKCGKDKKILKTIVVPNYYMKLRLETKNYLYLEMDGFSIQTLINTYIYRELPNNSVNIFNSGVCKNKYNKMHGYNLMDEADLGSGRDFIMKIFDKYYDTEFNINDDDKRYIAITNFLLQVILIIGHLQYSSLEFFHGDYKPENVFVKRCNKKNVSHFTFNVFGKEIRVKNMGFAVLIADFDRSSITIKDEFSDKKFRIISPILFKPFLTNKVNNIIKNYGDIDPDNIKDTKGLKLKKFFVSNFIPRKMDPTITILRSAGVKLFRDFDIYTFMIRLIETENIRKYFIDKKYSLTILSFMSKSFQNALFATPVKNLSLNESAFLIVEIFSKIKEPMINIFTDTYIDRLRALNYKLFR